MDPLIKTEKEQLGEDGLTDKETFSPRADLSPAEDRALRMEEKSAVANAGLMDAPVEAPPAEEEEQLDLPITAEGGVQQADDEFFPEPEVEVVGEPVEIPEEDLPVEATEEKKPRKYKIPVYGKEREYTLEDLKAAAAKVDGAGHRFEEAVSREKAATAKEQELAERERLLALREQSASPLPVRSDTDVSALPVQSDTQQVDMLDLFRRAEYEDDADARRQLNEIANRQAQPANLPLSEVQRVAAEATNKALSEQLYQQDVATAQRTIEQTYGDMFADTEKLDFANFKLEQLRKREPGYPESHYMLTAAEATAKHYNYAQEKKQEQSNLSKIEAKRKHSQVNNLGNSAVASRPPEEVETTESIKAQMQATRRQGFG